MKFNWGTGIVIAFAAFICFILFFVYRMSSDHHVDHQLVTEDYYQAELNYQNEIDAERNARGLDQKITTEKTEQGLLLHFPESYQNKNIQGTVSLYRPSNEHLDFDLPASLSDPFLLIPDDRLLEGRWDLKIAWEDQGKTYLQKLKITY